VRLRDETARFPVASLPRTLLLLGVAALVLSPRFPLRPLYGLPSPVNLEKAAVALAVLGGGSAFLSRNRWLSLNAICLWFGFLAIWKNGPVYLETVLSDRGVEGLPVTLFFLLAGAPALALDWWGRPGKTGLQGAVRYSLLCLLVLGVLQLLTAALIRPLDEMERAVHWMTFRRACEAALFLGLLAKARYWEVGCLSGCLGLMALLRWAIQWGGTGP